jgi:hypothetical protein
MASAIELYRDAYEMDYRKGDWQYAEELYRQVMREYPESDEAEYCRIHLERIEKLKGDPQAPALQSVRPTSSLAGFTVLNFVLLLTLMVAAGFLAYFMYQQQGRMVRTEQVLHGLLSQRLGDKADALDRYRAARKAVKQDAVASRFLAEQYLAFGECDLAEIEARYWELAAPWDASIEGFRKRLKAVRLAQSRGRR